MKKRCLVFLTTIAILALLNGIITPAFGAPYWVEGKVTAEPVTKRYRYIQVDGKTYILLPDSRISFRYEVRPGAFNDRPIAFHEIRMGRDVMIRVKGIRAYQLIVLE